MFFSRPNCSLKGGLGVVDFNFIETQGNLCPECNGEGKIVFGCAITHAIYKKCLDCDATGRRDVYKKKKKTQEEADKFFEERRKQKAENPPR